MKSKKQDFRKTGGPDIEAMRELQEALDQTRGVPDDQRWPLVTALLPDALLYRVVAAQHPTEEERMDLMGTLALTALHDLMGIEPNEVVSDPNSNQIVTTVIYGVMISFVAELEIRRKELCREIAQLNSPILFNPTVPLPFAPKEPGLKLEKMVEHYRRVSREELAKEVKVEA